MRRALIVVGKAPIPGRTKTRLAPPLSSEDAAALYRAFLLDTLEMAQQLACERTTVVHPRGHADALRELVPAHVALLEQRGDGLGDALAHAFEHHFAAGFDSAVLIGSDNPTLPARLVETAQARLRKHDDLAIGPTTDGGYYLIGMRQPHLGVFEHIEWSTPRVFAQTLQRAAQLDLHVHSAPEWYDVDEPSDLEKLQRELANSASTVARHTRAALEVRSLADKPV